MDLSLQFEELDKFMGIYGHRNFDLVFPIFQNRLHILAKEAGTSAGVLFCKWMDYLSAKNKQN